ncbi:MAG: hypothetical protein IPJ19_05460 [Planctomycetes bacterium]|nr:hypothetical protein [Planctomycetota bacterium]
MKRALLLSAACLVLCACVSTRANVGNLARASVTSDFHTYALRRVGLLPFQGEGLDLESARQLQAAFATELSTGSGLEVVPLGQADLEEVQKSEPFRRGSIKPATVIALAKRFRLDGVFTGTVTDVRGYTPQRLCVDMDLVASETGISIWSASAHLDASDERVRRGLEQWIQRNRSGAAGSEGPEIYLMSPRRFAECAAAQIAALL